MGGKGRKALLVVAVLLVGLTLGITSGFAATDCTIAAFNALGLTDQRFGYAVTFTSAEIVAASGSTPGHCYVKASMWPEIAFEMKMPVTSSWNGRFYYNGGGGWDGSIPSLTAGLNMGYASAGTNGGHTSTWGYLSFMDAAFGWPIASNPYALQKREDFGHRAAYEGSVLGKKVVAAYYGNGPAYSYWVGCSNGGRGATMMAQRHPEVFDGYIAGAPHFSYMGTTMWGVYRSQVTAGVQKITEAIVPVSITDPTEYMTYASAKLKTLADAVYKKCDGADGLVDGIVDAPGACGFDPARDLTICKGTTDATTCFTKDQIKGLKKIYTGVQNSAGTLLYPGMVPGAEIVAPGMYGTMSGWLGTIVATTPGGAGDSLAPPMYQYVAFDPAPGPSWSFRDYNVDVDPARAAATGIVEIMDALSNDYSGVMDRDAKIIHYHGWADALVTPTYSIQRYNEIKANMMETYSINIDSFYKFYLVPGMGHCSGGTGCGTVDWITPLVNWVEHGVAPGVLVGQRSVNTSLGWTEERTRPICPYPGVARYTGTGSIEDAANFICVNTVAATVSTGSVKLSRGTFTASLAIPASYRSLAFSLDSILCEGAKATNITRIGNIYRATFNTADMVNVTAGKQSFTVTAIIDQAGQKTALEGKKSVTVTD